MKQPSTVLITGGTSGIGFALAEIFARSGHNLALIGRNLQSLKNIRDRWQEQYGINVKYCMKDLAVSTTPDEVYQSIQSEMIDIDILVNNAGFGLVGNFSDQNLADQLEMLQVNITSLTHLTRLLLPEMLRRKEGRILNVASTAAYLPGPSMAVYYATKAYVLSFSQALSEELRGTGVTVTALCPGPTKTNFQERAGMTNTKLLKRMALMEARDVAEAGYRGLMNGKSVVIPGFMNKLSAQATRLAPRMLLARIAHALHGADNV